MEYRNKTFSVEGVQPHFTQSHPMKSPHKDVKYLRNEVEIFPAIEFYFLQVACVF